MAAPKSFQLAAKAAASDRDAEYEPIPVSLVDEEGKKVELVAHYPGDGAITLLMSSAGGDDGSTMMSTLFGVLSQTFSPDDYKAMRALVMTGEFSVGMLMEMFQSFIEEWTSFPTQPSSDSPRRRPSTGTRSTGRSPGKGSTQQPSLPADS